MLTVSVCTPDESYGRHLFCKYQVCWQPVSVHPMSHTEDICFVFLGGGLFRLQNCGRPLPLSICDLPSRHCTKWIRNSVFSSCPSKEMEFWPLQTNMSASSWDRRPCKSLSIIALLKLNEYSGNDSECFVTMIYLVCDLRCQRIDGCVVWVLIMFQRTCSSHLKGNPQVAALHKTV